MSQLQKQPQKMTGSVSHCYRYLCERVQPANCDVNTAVQKNMDPDPTFQNN